MLILAIESSCDETASAVAYVDEKTEKFEIRSSVIASQIDIHALYGGVVPEIASRAHAESLSKITYEALEKANVELKDIDAVAVSYAPGLIGALLTGVNFAKGLAFANNKPLIPVNHIKGHIAASYIEHDIKPPFLALAASGGHTSIINVKSYTEFETIGRTRDDAVGECFDKIARVMGIPYPGGAQMDKLAQIGDKNSIKFPSAAVSDDTLDYSFSGLKTAVINYLHNAEQKNEEICKENVSASLTKTIVESVITKLEKAIDSLGYDTIVVAGGVAANSHLRLGLKNFAEKKNIKLAIPSLCYCGDNAAMIAVQGYFEFKNNNIASTDLNAVARP
ncbi:MAG: tRNA (adenosine(37)-N6)-threonylcarbamoyltransferase complex transferase subunit TsaD [Ruminococcaceae bacterium]|nr:tRNA (adenosine(37)-N6)-threonylcarbamoyltransferase complex transferase subunit TsaD [Oscillospiraceae bacterium]